MNLKFGAVILAVLLFLTIVSAEPTWYNDTTSNDTCLVMYADQAQYYSFDGVIKGQLKFENNCGADYLGRYLEFYDSSIATSEMKVKTVKATDSLLASNLNVQKYKTEIVMVKIDPKDIYQESLGVMVVNDKVYGKIYISEQDIKDLTIDGNKTKSTDVYKQIVVQNPYTVTMYPKAKIQIASIPTGTSYFDFELKTSKMAGEFAFNIAGLTLLDPPYSPYDTNFVADWNFNGSNALLTDVNADVNHTAQVNGTYTATMIGPNTFTYGVTGKNSTAYRFNTTDANVKDALGTFKTKQFTLMTWFQSKSAGLNAIFSDMANRTGAQAAGWFVSMGISGAGKIDYYMGSVDGAPTETSMTLPGTFNDGAWHQLIVTYDGTTKRLFMDGNLTGSGQTAGLAYNATNYVKIGGAMVNNTPTWQFDGNLDEFAFWDRNLSLTDINNLWNAGAGTFYPFGSAPATFLPIDVNYSSPLSGIQGGTVPIVFKILDENTLNTIDINIYKSISKNRDYNKLIYRDTNLADGIGITCDGYIPFSTIRTCTYNWDTKNTKDGNYYIDVNAHDTNGTFDTNGSNSIYIQNGYGLDANDVNAPTVGGTTLSGFVTYTGFIQGPGNVIGGVVSDLIDYNFGSNWTVLRDDFNNGGALWRDPTLIKQYYGVTTNSTGQYVYTIENPGYIWDSNDYGLTWNMSDQNRSWYAISTSDSNSVVAAVSVNGKIEVSLDYARTWTSYDTNRAWFSIRVNSTGQYMIASIQAGNLYVSNDYGATWTARGPSLSFRGVAVDGNGQDMMAVVQGGLIYVSHDYGVTWNSVPTAGSRQWSNITMSKDGVYAIATTSSFPTSVYFTNNGGAFWTLSTNPDNTLAKYSASMGYDGQYSLVGEYGGYVESSINYGADWNRNFYVANWISVAQSNAAYNYLVNYNGYMYVSVRDRRGIDTTTCEYTDNNGLSWQLADYNNGRCVKYGVNINPGQTYIFNTRIRDIKGNIGYGLATKAYTPAVGTPITFYVKSTEGTSLEGVDINLFTLDALNHRVFYATVTSDITGTAIAFMNLGDTYGYDLYYKHNIVQSTNNLLISTSPIYFNIDTSVSGIIIPDSNNIYVSWVPSIDYLYSDVTQLVQTISSKSVKDFNIKIWQYNDSNNITKKTQYTVGGLCAKTCTITTLLAGFTFDSNKPLYVDLNLGLDSGARTIYTHKYVRPDTSTIPSPVDLLRNIRQDFACSADASLPCGPTMIISIVLTILIIAAIVLMTGYAGPAGIGIIALAVLGVMTYVSWFYWIAYFVLVLVTILFVGKEVVQ